MDLEKGEELGIKCVFTTKTVEDIVSVKGEPGPKFGWYINMMQ